MRKQQLWDKFFATGKIEYYLEYTGVQAQNIGGFDGTDKDKGVDTQSIEPQR